MNKNDMLIKVASADPATVLLMGMCKSAAFKLNPYKFLKLLPAGMKDKIGDSIARKNITKRISSLAGQVWNNENKLTSDLPAVFSGVLPGDDASNIFLGALLNTADKNLYLKNRINRLVLGKARPRYKNMLLK